MYAGENIGFLLFAFGFLFIANLLDSMEWGSLSSLVIILAQAQRGFLFKKKKLPSLIPRHYVKVKENESFQLGR